MFTPAAAPVFIGYRRADAAHAAARLRDSLRALGHRVFFDLSSIKTAEPFRQRIATALRECEVVLIVIGPAWLTVVDGKGRRRLDDPHDDVRVEVELALARPDVTVVPVLVDGAAMPAPEDLPPSMRGLCELNAAELHPAWWDHGVRRLHGIVESSVRRGWSAWAESLVVAAVVAVPAAVIAATGGLETDPANPDMKAENVLRLVAQRAELWAIVMAAVLGWVAWRRPGSRWKPAVRAGLLWGAAFGLAGALLHGLFTYVIDRDQLEAWSVAGGTIDTIRTAAYVLGIAVTGAGIGALIGGAWNPPGTARGLLSGLVAGGLLGWIVRASTDNPSTTTKILTSVAVAVAIVGAAVAAQWLTRPAAKEAYR